MKQDDTSFLAALANYLGDSKNNPARPLHSIMDKAAGVVAGPAIDAYQGMQRVWGENGDQFIPVEDINRTAQNIAEFAAYGTMPGKAGAMRKPAPQPDPTPAARPSKVYHYGKVPEGGQFDASKSVYPDTAFTAQTRKDAARSSNYESHPDARMHELNLSPDAQLFDFENPAHVAAAMQWYDGQFGSKNPKVRADVESSLKVGKYDALEPDPINAPGYTVNPYLKDNFDGYYATEYAGGPKNIAVHKPGHLKHPDGSTFFSDPMAAALLALQNQAQYEPDPDIDF